MLTEDILETDKRTRHFYFFSHRAVTTMASRIKLLKLYYNAWAHLEEKMWNYKTSNQHALEETKYGFSQYYFTELCT